MECLLNLSIKLLAGPIRGVGNIMHLSSSLRLLAHINVLKVLK